MSGGPLQALIRFALRRRVAVVVVAAAISVYGLVVLARLPVDVFPDLNRPTVSVLTESGGLSPEEVELFVTQPLERALLGAPGVERVRSVSGIGLSVVYVEFGFDADVAHARQAIAERLATLTSTLPTGVVPQMGPVASIMGEILLLGVVADDASVSPMALRTLADVTLRPRLLTVPGVAQVVPIGGEVRQVQVQVDPQRLVAYGLSIADVEHAAALAQGNTTGGFVDHGAEELLVRNIGRTGSVADIADTPVAVRAGVPVRLSQVATVRAAAAQKRGDAGVNGKPAVVLSIQKQPATSTTALTTTLEAALADLTPSLPPGVRLVPLFRQATFIEAAVKNVTEALCDGAVLVVLVLVLFLMNARTTLITLTAIPLSLIVAVLVFSALGLSLNTMTLGGLAVAVGELVDDAIVDVENVHRRLRENAARIARGEPALHPLRVVFLASAEVRGSIVFATALVVLVFVPLFALGGIEGRLFAPLGVAYVVSILASLLVSLTVTPALCALLLASEHSRHGGPPSDTRFVRALKALQARLLAHTLHAPGAVGVAAAALVVAALASVPLLPRSFLPAFNEGTATVSLLLPPGTSLAESNRIGTLAEELLRAIPEVHSTGRRTGRAELDEHAEGVHSSEIDVDFDDRADARPRAEVLAEMRRRLALIPGASVNIGQPISHRLDHLMSGVRAQVVLKLFGPDLVVLRSQGAAIAAALSDVEGVTDLAVEPQVLVPQLRIRVDRERAGRLGVRAGELTAALEGALAGKRVAQLNDGPQSVDVIVRVDDDDRADIDALRRLWVDTPLGTKVPLGALADITFDRGPNQILHDNGARRLVVSFNVAGRALNDVVDDVKARVNALPRADGVAVVYEGQFESQVRATRTLGLLAVLSLFGMIAVLHGHLRSLRLVAQVLLNIPLALVGSVAALWLVDLPLSVATLIGFITLCGIAARNSILLIDHYLHLVVQEGHSFGAAVVLRGSSERLVPVLMTALTAGLALVPLAFAAGAPGKEILHPVAVVILGGLLSSTLLDLLVTPAVFLRFGGPAVAERLSARVAARNPDPLADPPADPTADAPTDPPSDPLSEPPLSSRAGVP